MPTIQVPGGWAALVGAALAGVLGVIGVSTFTTRSEQVYVGAVATGTVHCPSVPTDNDTFSIEGVTYGVMATASNDAGAPTVNCLGGACDTPAGCGAAVQAAVNAYSGSYARVVGFDGGVVYLAAKDAGLSFNIPSAVALHGTSTSAGTATALTTETGTGTATTTDTDTDSATVTTTATATRTNTTTTTATVTSTVTNTTTSAGSTTGMLGGYDPAATGGPILGIIGNSYNPATSGLIAPLGSIARTSDGTKAWWKTGTANTDWSPINTF